MGVHGQRPRTARYSNEGAIPHAGWEASFLSSGDSYKGTFIYNIDISSQ